MFTILWQKNNKVVYLLQTVWLFSETQFKSFFLGEYMEVQTFDALDGIIGYGQLKARFKGIIYKKVKK